MEDEEKTPLATALPVAELTLVRKRSPRERFIVWSGIAALLVIVAIEWNSQRQFHSSLNRLEKAIAAPSKSGGHHGIHRDEIEQHIDGMTFREQKTRHFERLTHLEEEEPDFHHELMFRWPSLFKTYQLVVTVNSIDRAILVAADMPGDHD